jgi:uncharacterized protein YqeY
MRTSLRRDLTAALKTRDRVAITALRSALAAIENAEALSIEHTSDRAAEHGHIAGAATGVGAAEAERRHLTEVDLHAIVEQEVHERSVAAEEYEQIGRHHLAEQLRSEAEVLSQYLRTAS